MNRSKRYMYNSVAALAAEIITMVVGFVTPRVILATYGSDVNGLTSSILNLISYFNLVEAGLSNATVYALYKPVANGDKAGVSSVMTAARRMYIRSGLVFALLAIALAVFYPLYIKMDSLTMLEVGALVLILGVSNALNFFTLSKYRSLLNADQRMYVISIASIVHALINTAVIVALASPETSVVTLRFIALIAVVARTLILYIYCRKRYGYIDYKAQPDYASLNKSGDALYHEILFAIHKGAPIFLLTLFIKDMAQVSVYNVYSMVITGVAGILAVFSNGLAPSFGNVITLGEEDTLRRAYGEFEFSYYAMITAVYSVTLIMILPFVSIYTRDITDATYYVPIYALLFTVNSLIHNLRMPPSMLVVSAGLYRETKSQTLIQVIISVTLGAILVKPLGITGVLLAATCANLYRACAIMLFIPKTLTHLPASVSFKRALRVILTICATVAPFYYIRLEPAGYIEWALTALAVAVYASAISLISAAIFEMSELKLVIKRVTRMLKR